MASGISMGARREVLAAVARRYRAAGRVEKGRILDELTATTGWHRKHAVRALSIAGRDRPRPPRDEGATGPTEPATSRRRKYASVRDALIALWEASDRVCGKRLVSMIPVLLPAIERHGRLKPTSAERALLTTLSAATIDRMLIDVKVAAAGGAGGESDSTRRFDARCRSALSMTGQTRRQAFARSTWSRTVGPASPARLSRR
jgi:hypothetical protein